LRSPATEEVIRKIERALGVDLGVRFNAWSSYYQPPLCLWYQLEQ
jgi:hypothetical protein